MAGVIAGGIVSAFGVTSTVGVALIQIGVGLALNFLAQALLGKPDEGEEQRQDLSFPDELPPFRYVYGDGRAVGTPFPHAVVGENGYGVYLLNSLPSKAGEYKLFIDGKEITLTGDPFDFSGDGATATEKPYKNHLNVWIGLGDQTGPPQTYLDEAPYIAGERTLGFRSTDAGYGSTIAYVKYRAGAQDTRRERWQSVPPSIEFEGISTPVWDMRDPAQDQNDPTTWERSSNHALNALHALMNNPFRPYPERFLHLDQWEVAANVADQLVPLRDGGSEARYTVDGTLIFNGIDLYQMMKPLMEAGAATLVRMGGKLGVAPGAPTEKILDLTDVIGTTEFRNMRRGEEIPTHVDTVYRSPERGFANAALNRYTIPGSPAPDPKVLKQDLPFTISPQRAMRLRKIAALRGIEMRQLKCELPPASLRLVLRSGVAANFGAAFDGTWNGQYEAVSLHPTAYLPGSEQNGVALRIPATLQGVTDAIWDWDATEEEDVYTEEYEQVVSGLNSIPAIKAMTGEPANRLTGIGFGQQTELPQVLYRWEESPSFGIRRYEWQARVSGGDWGDLGTGSITVDEDTTESNLQVSVAGTAGEAQDFRVRPVGFEDISSEYLPIADIVPVLTEDLGIPTIDSIEESGTNILVSVTAPNNGDVTGLTLATGSGSTPTNLVAHVEATATDEVEFIIPAPDEETRYFVRAYSDDNTAGTFSAGTDYTPEE